MLGICAVAQVACVTASRHEETTRERNQLAAEKRELEEQLRLLRVANGSLEDEVAALKDEREDLFQRRDQLTEELETKTRSAAELKRKLDQREEELSVTASALIEESRKVGELQTTYDALVGDLEQELARGEIHIEQLRDGLKVDVSQDILFDSGSAALSESGAKVLVRVADRLAPLDYEVSVEGHTDGVPISGRLKTRYPTNWELAGARAASVTRLLVDHGVAGEKLAAVSYGPYRPVADGSTPEGRALNRRIEIRLRPTGESLGAAPPAP